MNVARFFRYRAAGGQYLAAGLIFLVLGFALSGRRSATPLEWHGTILVFFGILPIAFGALGNGLMAPAEKPPAVALGLNAAGLVLFYLSAAGMILGLAASSERGLIAAMVLNLAAWLACSAGFFAMLPVLCRANAIRAPFLLGSLLFTALLLLLTCLPLEFVAVGQLAGILPEPEIVARPLPPSGDAANESLLWHHVFWFMGHPEVTVLLLLLAGLVAEGARFGVAKLRGR